MAHILWSQDFFAKGELSPLMYSRVTLQAYYQGLKRAKNVICFPQGSAGKRFGTIYLNTLLATNYKQIYFKSFQYLNECCYLVIFRNAFVDIYLEGELIATVASPILADEVQLIDHTILENRFRVTTGIYPPMDLKRAPNAPTAITGFTANSFTVTGPFTANTWFPVRFTAGTIPVTAPQIHANKTYFARFISTTEFSVFMTAENAASNTNPFVIFSAGVGSNAIFQNTWTFSNVVFSALPQFDFQNPLNVYNNSTTSFTPTAVSGNTTMTRTAGTFNFTSNYVGGAIIGNGGIARITAVNGTNQASITVLSEHPFNNTTAIIGTNIVITEPAWNDAQGWPRKCSSFQNRAFFANTDTLSNGLWGSVSNQFNNFDDMVETDDDGAISWFPTSDTVNYIQFIVPYRSLTIHTNSGVYSTPLSSETVITPQNFSLSLQDSTPADNVQPQGIDNQIIVLSGNDAHSLLWDGFNNAYSSNIISVANEQLIRNPIDEAAYIDRIRAGSRYMFIVNDDGSMAIYQSLIGENVSGFTDAELEQNYGNAYFRAVTSNFDGRAWFVTERQLATAGTPIAISGFTATTLTATAIGLPTNTFTAIEFATAGTLPGTSPQIELNTIYWGVGVNANTFKIYLSQADAIADDNALLITSAGTSSNVTAYPLVTTLLIEQLSFDSYVDCAGIYPTPLVSGSTSVISGQPRFNAQDILMQGDGFGFETVGVDGNVNFEAHGVATPVSVAQYGFPINVEITPMPISLSMTGNPKSSNLIDTKHLRFATFLFADTIGGTITQDNLTFPIQLQTLNEYDPGSPPKPITGSFEISVFGGWDDFKKSSFTINHTEPFGMRLTGIFYNVDA
jgi:hypothetical protein